MTRLVLTLVAGAFGSMLVFPIAHAQDYGDISNDANQVRQDQRAIRHDRREQREDLEHGDLGAAAHEQEEIDQRRANRNATQEDLNNDLANRYHRYHNEDDD